MGKTSKRMTSDTDYAFGASAADNTGKSHPLCEDEEDYMGTFIEGGVRAGGVSYPETLPFQPRVPKRGYDEHQEVSGDAQVHGMNGVEGIGSAGGVPNAPPRMSPTEKNGFSCPHGCGSSAKTAHGLARHVHAKHGGFGGIGKSFKHGASYKEGDKPVEFQARSAKFNEYRAAHHGSDKDSSYSSGDQGGAHGR